MNADERRLETCDTGVAPVRGSSAWAGRPCRNRTLVYLCSSVFICGLIPGCRNSGIEGHRPVGDLGPVEPIEQLVDQINSNNEKLPTLRGEGDFSAHIRDPTAPSGKPQVIDGQLTLLYAQPRSIRIVAKNVAIGRIMEIAGNAER